MEMCHIHKRRLWIGATLAGLSITVGIGLCQIQPSGKKAGVIQFDAISELNTEWGERTRTFWFARYWACEEYYAAALVWTEPHGRGFLNMKGMTVLSDRTGFRICDNQFPWWGPSNATYPKPLPERGPFQWLAGMYESAEMRFAEAEALSRRVHASDLDLKNPSPDAEKIFELKGQEGPDGIKKKLAQLRVHAKDGRIESMDMFDAQKRPLGTITYEYDSGGNAPALARLVAELPPRSEKVAFDANTALTYRRGNMDVTKVEKRIKELDYVHHRGGRTCAVAYRDVVLGDKVLRIPAEIEVRRMDDRWLMRSARLMNFKRVNLDKAAVWDAAKAFAGFSSEDRALQALALKFLEHGLTPNLGPMKIDPNDAAFVRRLVAKYPVPELPRPVRGPDGRIQRGRQEEKPKPKRVDIDPNDARAIRQLNEYHSMRLVRLGEQAKATGQTITREIPEDEREVRDLLSTLKKILSYHRAPVLPEDRTPEPNDLDLKLVRQLQGYYEPLAMQHGLELPRRLKALDALSRLDLIRKDYAAFEQHTDPYLQALQDANLMQMYMVGGYDGHIDKLVEAGQQDRANKFMRQWADRSAAANDADGVYRFCGSDVGGKGSPWAGLQLLDQFLKRPGLSPLERYEGLALTAIALDKIDKLLSAPQDDSSKDSAKAHQAQWVLTITTKAQIARRLEPAIREALSAWQSLGPARLSEAKPYSTANMSETTKRLWDNPPEATRLQETSALLDQIIRQRSSQRGVAPRPGESSRAGTNR